MLNGRYIIYMENLFVFIGGYVYVDIVIIFVWVIFFGGWVVIVLFIV